MAKFKGHVIFTKEFNFEFDAKDKFDVNEKMMNDVFDNVNCGTVNEAEVTDLIDQLQQHDQIRVGDELVNANSKNPVIAQKQEVQPQGQQISNGYFS